MLTLYSLPHSPYSARCRIAMYHKQLDIQLLPPPGGLRSPEYRVVVPTSKVPALVTESETILESGAILEYLEDLFPDTPLRAQTPEKRARQRGLISFLDFSIAPQIFVLFQAVLGKLPMDKTQESIQTLQKHFGALEDMFTQDNRAQQTELDLADCGLIPSMFFARWLLGKLGHFEIIQKKTQLEQWWQHRSKIPAVEKTLQEISTALQAFAKRT